LSTSAAPLGRAYRFPVSEGAHDSDPERSSLGKLLIEASEVNASSSRERLLSFDFDGASSLPSCPLVDRPEESSGQEPGGRHVGGGDITTSGIWAFARERLLVRSGLPIAPALFAEEVLLVEGAETLRLRRSSLARSDSDLSLGSSLREGLSFEMVCSGLGDATAFGFDFELDEGVGRDDLDFEAEITFGEWDDLDSLSDGLVDAECDGLVFESAESFDSDPERIDLVLELEAAVDSDFERES
jgi:hypothetical protein